MEFRALFFLLISMTLVGCGTGEPEKIRVLLDNPTSWDLDINIGAKKVKVKAYESKWALVPEGKHRIITKNEQNQVLLDTNNILIIGPCLLNITQSPYILEQAEYAGKWANTTPAPERLQELFGTGLDSVQIGNRVYYGDLIYYPKNRLIIPSKWEFGPDQPWDKSIRGKTEFDRKSLKKMWRERDFEGRYSGPSRKITSPEPEQEENQIPE